MILNTYAVLAAFVASLRLLAGLLLLGAGLPARRAAPAPPEGHAGLEDRGYLAFLLALLLVGLSVASWPLLYLLLQSYVPEWSHAGVMCIYGVMQVGEGDPGPSRFLPVLLRAVQLTRPAVVFAGGSWFVLYLLNRGTPNAALTGRLFAVLLPLGALAAADAAAELAYLAIPKKEALPPGGCCVAADDHPERFLPHALLGDESRPWLWAAYYGANLALIAALAVSAYWQRRARLAPLLAGGAVALAASGLFLREVAAPVLLGLPHHHCPYDLVGEVPEAVVAVGLFLGGCFFLGWAAVAAWLGRCRETEPILTEAVRSLLRLSLGAYLASLAMLSLELALA
jgi:hypothetical protein